MKRSAALLAALALAFVTSAARADATARWTAIAADTARHAQADPVAAERVLAVVREAMATARSAGNGNGNGDGDPAAGTESRDAAVAVAAFAVLETLYPAQRENLEAELAITFSRIPETDAKAQGAAHGRRIAAELLRRR